MFIFSFEDIDIPSVTNNGSCVLSYIELGPTPKKRLCGVQGQHPFTYISEGTSYVHIKFVVHGLATGRGFKLTYIRGMAECLWLHFLLTQFYLHRLCNC